MREIKEVAFRIVFWRALIGKATSRAVTDLSDQFGNALSPTGFAEPFIGRDPLVLPILAAAGDINATSITSFSSIVVRSRAFSFSLSASGRLRIVFAGGLRCVRFRGCHRWIG